MRAPPRAVTERHDEWTANHPSLPALASLLRACGPSTLGLLLPRIASVFSELLHHERDAQMRLTLLRLLDELMEDPARSAAFRGPLAGVYLMAVLLPPCVWRTGKVAAAVRYAAVVSMGTFFERGLIDKKQLVEAMAIGAQPSDPKVPCARSRHRCPAAWAERSCLAPHAPRRESAGGLATPLGPGLLAV